jgi:alkylation response protein AidB-like acyl-CoA dehydrogenase
MDFKLSGEQTLIKDSVERFVAQHPVPADPWNEFAKLGWLGIGAPEDLGGFGGALETMLVMEAFGRGLYLEPFAACAVFPAAILRTANRSDLLENLIEGGRFAVAYEEAGARYDPALIATQAERSSSGYVLSGKKIRVAIPRGDPTFLVSARLDDRLALFAIRSGTSGLRRNDSIAEDGTTATHLELDRVVVGEDALIGPAGKGLDLLERGLEYANAALCAEAVGLMGTMFELTLGYLKERHQFGTAIGSFQALQHRMAEMFMELELARSMAYVAAMSVDDESDPDARARALAGAKIQIARSGRFVAQNAVQLHGAIAMTQEYKLGGYFKRMTSLERLFGDIDYHLQRYIN